MGNGNLLKTTGTGSTKLCNHDGSTRILRDVRYVPKLKKNLISLGDLESKGLVVMMQDGVLKATSRCKMGFFPTYFNITIAPEVALRTPSCIIIIRPLDSRSHNEMRFFFNFGTYRTSVKILVDPS